ncbi:glycosyltransferase family 9 protein [Pigmentibacter sp. JX0631]|uniref:glycosyltransferase family 9 protein n=1 Tax=Pigmentibacter sp. JX0631 TaxID=2976982 RepID=UPI002469C403|nr:glycosyltransferase family 9 protein [Pigmentibacter sp. JX0631]WGL58755.1 glycosyltransferase family 9 protein [Pigmentibacter sp. JX0631]
MNKINQYNRLVFLTRLSAIGDVLIAANSVFCLIENNYFPVFITSPSNKDIALKIKNLQAFICFEKNKTPSFFLQGKEVLPENFLSYILSIKTISNAIYIDLQNTNRSKRVFKYLKEKLNIGLEKKYIIEKYSFYRILLVLLSFFYFKQKTGLVPKNFIRIKSLQKNLLQKIILNDQENFLDTYNFSPFLPANYFFPKEMQYICLFPGASSFIKMWPKENFRFLIEKIKNETNLSIILCGSINEQYLGEYLDFPKSSRVINMVSKTELSETLDIIANAKFVVTNDSFAAHAADNFNVPGTVIFGATSPQFGFVPLSKDIKFEYLNLNCSPCSRHGKKSNCRFKNLKCLKEIDPNNVFTHILLIINQRNLPH